MFTNGSILNYKHVIVYFDGLVLGSAVSQISYPTVFVGNEHSESSGTNFCEIKNETKIENQIAKITGDENIVLVFWAKS